MAQLSCTLDEFYSIIGPRIRNDVQSVTKKKKSEFGLVCQHCNNKVNELEAAHKHGSSRKEIIKSVLNDYKSDEEKYLIPDVQEILDKLKVYHKSNDIVFFLCKECHRKYDNNNKIKHVKTKHSSKITISGTDDLKSLILTLFRENPKLSYTPSNMYEIIKQRDTKYYSDTLWGLWKKGFLKHPQRGYYQWNEGQN